MADRYLAALLLASLSCACLADPVELRVGACMLLGDDGFVLRFELINASGDSITIPSARLPWGVDGAIIVAHRGTAIRGSFLRRVYLVQDDFSDGLVLRNGERKYGDVYISHIFPDLRNGVSDRSVTIMWTYSVLGLSAKQETIGGALGLQERDRCKK